MSRVALSFITCGRNWGIPTAAAASGAQPSTFSMRMTLGGGGSGGLVRNCSWASVDGVTSPHGPLAHGLSVLQLVAQLAALTVAPEGRRWLRRTVPVLAALGLEVVALFALGASDIGDWVPPLELGQVLGIGQLLLGFGVTGVVLAGLTAWAAADVSSRFWRERTAAAWCRVIPVFWALLPPLVLVAMSLVRPYASARYVFSALPGVLLLVAGLLARIRSWRLLAAASLVIAVLLLKDQGRATEVGIEDWRGLTACIAANATDGDPTPSWSRYIRRCPSRQRALVR